MIQEIGLMIGMYIITRMAKMLVLPKERSAGILPNVLGALTILITVLVIADLMLRGSRTLQDLLD